MALGTVLEILVVLDPAMLDRVLDGVANDPIGETLANRSLPKRVVPVDDF